MNIKKLIASLFGAVSLAIASRAAELGPTAISDFRGGLSTTEDSSRICDGCATEAINVDVWKGAVEKRRGSILQNTSSIGANQPVSFLHEFVDSSNNVWMLAVSSNSIYKSNNGGSTFSLLTSTFGITNASLFSAANAFSKAYLTDGTTNVIVFDGTTVTASTVIPKGTQIAFAFGRLFVADVSGSHSTLYACRNGDSTDWTTDSLNDAGDAQTLTIRQNDGYSIRALYLFRDELLVFKDYSIDKIVVGSDGNSLIVVPISSYKGTRHPKSIQARYNEVMFLSNNNFSIYNGNGVEPASKNIKPEVDSIRQLVSGGLSWTQTDGADWNSGTFSSTNTVISSTAFSGSIFFTTQTIDDFTDGNITSNPVWVSSINKGDNTSTVTFNNGLRQYSVADSSLEQGLIYSTASFTSNLSTGTWTIKFSNSFVNGSGVIPQIRIALYSAVKSTCSITAYISKNEATLQDTDGGANADLLYSSAYALNNSDVTVYITRKEDNTWTLQIGTVSASINFPSPDERTFNKIVLVSFIDSNGNSNISNDTTFSKIFFARRSDIWVSQSYNIGNNILSWGTFQVTDTNGGAVATYTLYTDTDSSHTASDATTFTSSQTITNGNIPTIAVGPYVFVSSSYTRNSSGTYTTDDFTVQWFQANVTPPIASIVYEDHYMCAVAIDSTTINDTILVNDPNKGWVEYKGMYAGAMSLYRQKPFYGSGLVGNVYRFQVDGVFTDSGTAISSSWVSKEFDFGYPSGDKTLQRYRVVAERTVNSDVIFSYGVNRGTKTNSTLDLDLFSGLFRQTIKPSSLTYQRGVSHSFKFSDSDAGQYFKIFSVTLEPRLETQE